MEKCKHCGKPLNKSIYSEDRNYKSCPRCSTIDGEEHIFLPYPFSFGTTTHRVTPNNPDGPQSYCVEHRGNSKAAIPINSIKCSKIK